MFCPSCGKEVPPGSSYCLYCGSSITVPANSKSKTQIEWEYRDFVFGFTTGEMWARIGSGAYSEAGARLEFWQAYQDSIRLKLQRWLDDGWQPIGEIGPAGITIRTYMGAKYSVVFWVFILVVSAMMLFIPLLFITNTYAEPTEFRLKMRRPKPEESVASNQDDRARTIKLHIKRLAKFEGFLVILGVYADNMKIGELDNGGTQIFEISGSARTISVGNSSQKSQPIAIEGTNSDDMIYFECWIEFSGIQIRSLDP